MARSSQRKVPAAGPANSKLGSALGSGVRGARRNAVSPPSGVHTRQDLLHVDTPPHGPVAPVRPPSPSATYVPPRPAFDSEPQHTQVKAPDPRLLAVARGEERVAQVRSLTWFLCGVLVGALVVWSQTRDTALDVYRARMWVASSLRALHERADMALPSVGVPAPAPAQGPAASAPVPVVDVATLPRADRTPHPPAVTAPAPTQPGAPALSHAPGPR